MKKFFHHDRGNGSRDHVGNSRQSVEVCGGRVVRLIFRSFLIDVTIKIYQSVNYCNI